MGPSIYLCEDERVAVTLGFQSLAGLRRRIPSGHSAELWHRLYTLAEGDVASSPLTPRSRFPERPEVNARHNNVDAVLCNAVGERMLRCALAWLITSETRFQEAALEQMEVLFDENTWPEWRDLAHPQHPADLRTGQLGMTVGLAYNWLAADLSVARRRRILDGLTQQAIAPYVESVERKAWWTEELNNWHTVVVGGMGICGMALGADHPQAEWLVEFSLPRMRRYLSIYGPDGEFNESPSYANATFYPTAYFHALRYYRRETHSRLASFPFPETCVWTVYQTVPPGRIVAFGDVWTGARPQVDHVCAIAAASRSPVLQWYYLTHAQDTRHALRLLWFDPTLEPAEPGGRLPRGRAFAAHGGCVTSRTSWDPSAATAVVYGKTGREANHEHNDAGQVCLDAGGAPLLVDLGAPPRYPADFFGENRQRYYNASGWGHNVLMFGDDPNLVSREPFAGGELCAWDFDEARGGFWTVDLSGAYANRGRVLRTVVHLYPGILVVRDRVVSDAGYRVSLRWHYAGACILGTDSSFILRSSGGCAAGMVTELSGKSLRLTSRHHRYRSPFDTGRLGEALEQKSEPYLEFALHADSCDLLSLFLAWQLREAEGSACAGGRWHPPREAAVDTFARTITAAGVTATVYTDEGGNLCVRNETDGLEWTVSS